MKNLFIKRMLKGSIFPLIGFINKLVPKSDNKVLLYIPSKRLAYSCGILKDYLQENEYDKKYKISYGVEDLYKWGDGKLIEKLGFIKSALSFLTTRHVFYTSGQLPIKPSKLQVVIHIHHGAPTFKPIGKLANINNGDEFFFTYMVATSELYIPIMSKEFECPESCIKVVGDPMIDAMLKSPKGVYDFSKYDKVLVWVPTFRQSDILGYKDSDYDTLVPLFDTADYPELNSLCEERNIKMIVKLHPIQTVPDGMQRHFSHLNIYSHDEFVKSGFELFTLVANSDGLIGDYSTLSMHYLVTDKPQAYVVPDIEDYAANRGFVFENPENYMGGHIVKTKEEFLQFVKDFAEGNDVYKEKRHKVCDKIHKYKDAKACDRIVELSGMSI